MVNKNLICFGEILWDMLPSGAQPGGAPMNVALRAQSLGMNTKIISKIGKDALGNEILNFISDRGADTSLVQQDDLFETGKVNVSLNQEGIASYDIVYPSAWDKIDFKKEALEEVQKADAFVFGTLVTRDKHSKTTLLHLLEKARFAIFDINLRPPHYQIPLIIEFAQKSDLLKLNDEELLILTKEMGVKSEAIEDNILFLAKEFNCHSICITKGANGAVLYLDGNFYSHPGFKVDVVDTVGAGDSFLATLIYYLLHHSDPQKAIEMACAMGSLVATKKGATAEIQQQEISDLLSK